MKFRCRKLKFGARNFNCCYLAPNNNCCETQKLQSFVFCESFLHLMMSFEIQKSPFASSKELLKEENFSFALLKVLFFWTLLQFLNKTPFKSSPSPKRHQGIFCWYCSCNWRIQTVVYLSWSYSIRTYFLNYKEPTQLSFPVKVFDSIRNRGSDF